MKLRLEQGIRRAIWLSLVSAAMFVFMVIGVVATDHSKVLAEKDNYGVLTTRIDQLSRGQDEVKSTLGALQIVVQDQRDKQNQMQGMLIGFGGFAALLQVLNAVMQFRSGKTT